MQGTLLTYIVVSLVLVVLSVPLIRRRVKPNFFYGYRIPLTLDNPDLWFDVTAYFGRLLAGAGVAVALVALGLYLIGGLDAKDYATDCAVVLLIGLFVTLGLSWRYMLSLTR